MPRRGGIVGGALRLLESGVERAIGVPPAELGDRARLVESLRNYRVQVLSADVELRRLGRVALGELKRGAVRGQDDEPEGRISLAQRIREVAQKDSQMLFAVRLRNAFCFGRGVPEPKANDPDVQEHLSDFWDAPANKAELTTPEAQWRCGKDLWETAELFFVVFADGLDGRVLLGSLQHGQVINVVRDPKVWRRVLWYVVEEYAYAWDYERHQLKQGSGTKRIVYYESLEGFAELEEEFEQGRTEPPPPPPRGLVRPGRIHHPALNRGKEQAFGSPEMRTNLKWAAAFNDLLGGQVQKAQAAQQYLMKVTARGTRSAEGLEDLAMRAVGRRSPLARASLEEPPALGAELPPAGQYPGEVNRNARPGSQWWGTDAMQAEPFDLKSGGAEAHQDLESASHAFALGTNYPGHYYFGDPGSLAGSMSVELPVLKLSDVDQRFVEGFIRTLLDLRIKRAIEVGLLSERRPPTEEEIAAGVEVGPDGQIERDLTYSLEMPDPLRRNLPELMQLAVDTATTFDPNGTNEPLTRALVGYTVELLDMPDGPALVERVMKAWEEQAAAGPLPPGEGDPATFTGPDGQQHTSANPAGVKQKSEPVVEAAVRELWRRLTVALDEDDGGELLASLNGGGG